MFGADTSLVMDALQIAALAAAAGGGAIWLLMRRRKGANQTEPTRDVTIERETGDLESRVRVLERIATDRNSTELANEIEALRDTSGEPQLEEQAQ